jgi:hypothetical protein
MSYCVNDNNSFLRNCNIVSFFFEKILAIVSHASFGIVASQIFFNIYSSRTSLVFLEVHVFSRP